MANLRISAAVVGLAMVAAFALPASADIGSKADCEYEGGKVFDMPNEAQVCIVQIRPEEYRNDEVYDGQQLGINECKGVVLNEGLYCKITLVEGKKPKMTTKAEMEAAAAKETATMTDKVIDKAKDMAQDEAEKQMEKQAKKKVKNLLK